ncbi:MAG: hypothetical protein D6744_09050, partial [Planctomycetota bacterium]
MVAARRRERWGWVALLAAIACAAGVLAVEVFFCYLVFAFHDAPLLNAAFGVGVAICGGAFASQLVAAWRARARARRLVLQTDAAVCPRCVRPLAGEPCAYHCTRCGDFFDQEWLADYWLVWATHPPSARRLLVARPQPPPRSFLGRLLTGNARWGVIAAGIVAIVLVTSWVEHASFVGAALRVAPMLGAGFAYGSVLCVWLQMRRPADLEPRCRRCGYQRGPTNHHPTRCPECGLAWSPASFVRGRPEQPFWKAIMGAGAMAMVALLLFT